MFQRYYGRVTRGMSFQYRMRCRQQGGCMAFYMSTNTAQSASSDETGPTKPYESRLENLYTKHQVAEFCRESSRVQRHILVDPVFDKAIQQYICTEDAFPDSYEQAARWVYARVEGQLLNPQDTLKYPLSRQFEMTLKDIQYDMYYSTLGLLCRPRKVDDIDNFDPRMEEEHLNHCRYLLEDDRFARRGYLCTGGRLESEAIGEVIHHVFCKSGMVKLEKHALVPKPLIALAYVLMRHCFESILNPEHGDHREMFKQENYSMWLYRDTVPDGFREFIQDIDWDDVENVQVGVVNQPPVEFRGVYSYIQEAKEAIWSSYPDYEEKS